MGHEWSDLFSTSEGAFGTKSFEKVEVPMIHIAFNKNGVYLMGTFNRQYAVDTAKNCQGALVSLPVAEDFRTLSDDQAA